MSIDNFTQNFSKLNFQEHVFKRWINHILLKKNVKINNLYDELANGIHIVYFIESLTRHEFKSKIKNPSFHSQKMENITMVLKYLQDNEHIKFLNIDSSNILNKDTKIILGFIWHLIEYFSIFKPLEFYFSLQNISGSGKSAKQKFLTWLKSILYPISIKSLSHDLKDGIIIGALVNSYDNDLCADWKIWNEKDAMENAKCAIETAAEKLGVPALIQCHELVDGKLDEKCLMTYLSQFILLEYRNKRNTNDVFRINGLDQSSYAINEPIYFTIESIDQRQFEVKLISPSGDSCFVDCIESLPNYAGYFRSYKYTPSTVGEFHLSVISEDCNQSLSSVFILIVNNKDLNNFNSQIFQNNNSLENRNDFENMEYILTFKGRGIQPVGIRVGDNVEFVILIADIKYRNFLNQIYVTITSPENHTWELKSVRDVDSVICSYSPKLVGTYEIMITIKNALFQKLFKINVADECVPKIVAFGPGLKYANITDLAIFIVEINGESGTLNFTIEGPNEAQIECKDNSDGSATIIYWPVTEGEYAVHILYDDQDIKDSPFMVEVTNKKHNIDLTKIKYYGSVLNEGYLTLGQITHFTVDLSESDGILDYLFVECYDRIGNIIPIHYSSDENNDKRTYSFVSHAANKIVLFITYDGISITDSLHMIHVVENFLSNKIKVEGSGLQSAFPGKETLFYVDCRQVNSSGNLEVMVTDSNLNQIPCSIESSVIDPNIYSVRYIPPFDVSRCLIEILFNKISVYDEPFIVPILSNSDSTIENKNVSHERDCLFKSHLTDDIKTRKQNEIFQGFSDIFLDPNSDSLLKLVAPPQVDHDIQFFNLPLPPVDVIDDSGDNSLENGHIKFPLSTVFEESEENYSVRDSIFSSGTHSRASIKDELVSLSRKSSFTLAPSPNILVLQNHNKTEIIPSVIKSNDLISLEPPNICQLPPKPNHLELETFNLKDTEINEFYFDDNLPLPEPPSDCELLILNEISSLIQFSEIDSLTTSQDEIQSSFPILHLLPNFIKDYFHKNSIIEIINDIYSVKIGEIVKSFKCFLRPYENSVDILFNEVYFRNKNVNVDYILSDYGREEDKSLSEVLPVTHMGAIMSPFDDDRSCMSDSSDDCFTIENHPLNDLLQLKKNNTLSAKSNFSVGLDSEIVEDLKVFQQINSREIVGFEYKNQYSKILKEFTTSEISEISETSQWLSNEDRLNSYFNEEHFEDQSFINSFSEIPKSSSSNIVQVMQFLNEHHETNIKNTNIWKANLISYSNIQSEIIDLTPLSYEVVVNLTQNFKKNQLEENTFNQKQISWDSDNGTDSFISYSFPDPPSELLNSNNDICISDNSNCKLNENIFLKSKEEMSETYNTDNQFNLTFDIDKFSSYPKTQLDHSSAQLKYHDQMYEQFRLTLITTTSSFPAISKPLTFYKNERIRYDIDHITKFKMEGNTRNMETKIKTVKNQIFSEKSFIMESNKSIDFKFPIRKQKERSKSSNFSVEKINGEFFRPMKNLYRKHPVKRRCFSQSHVYDFPSLHSFALSKNNSLEAFYRPFDAFKYEYSTSMRSKNMSDHFIRNKVKVKDDHRFYNKPKENVKYYEDPVIKIDSYNKQYPYTKGKLIKDKTVTNVDEKDHAYFLSNLLPEKDTKRVTDTHFVSKNMIPEVNIEGDGLMKACINKPNELFIRTHNQGADGISLSIEGPSKADIKTLKLPNEDCRILYVVQTPGEYLLIVKHNEQNIKGSPFKIIARANDTDKSFVTAISTSKKAYAEGQGITDAIINFSNQFNIYTKDAGPGGLSLSIEGPSKAIIEFKDSKNGVCGVTYKVVEPGHYTCIIKFNRKHIKGSPFNIHVRSKPSLEFIPNESSAQLEHFKPKYQVGKKSIFKTNLGKINFAPGKKVLAFLCPPSGKQKEIYVNYDSKKNLLWAEFIPNEIGNHWLYLVDESNKHSSINYDLSFQIVVEECENYDLTKFYKELESIKVFGKGLIKGRAGSSNIFHIEIGDSVGGALNVTVDGPSKVEIKCHETDKGFKFSFIPSIQGDYLVTIKYGGEYQIKGSPFQVKILPPHKMHSKSTPKRVSSPMSQSSITEFSSPTNNTDISLIKCYGSGLAKARINSWMDFYVDAARTEYDDLFVSIMGPNEPCEEIRIINIENNRYLISYKPKEKGNHCLKIKWGDSHLHCSPLIILVE